MQKAAADLAQKAHWGVSLAALTDIDAFSALGSPVFGTDAFGAIPNYISFLTTGNVTGSDGLAGIDGFSTLGASSPTDLDAFNAIPNYANFLNGDVTSPDGLAGIDGFSTLGATKLSDIDAFSALPNYQNFLTSGDLSRATGLSGIDAFSALPTYSAVLGGDIGALAPDTTDPDNPVGGIAAFSAIPAYLGIPPTVPAPDFPSTGTSPLFAAAKTEAPQTQSQDQTPSLAQDIKTQVQDLTTKVEDTTKKDTKPTIAALSAVAPPANPAPAADPSTTTPDPGTSTSSTDTTKNKKSSGSYSGVFSPKGIDGKPLLFGNGGAADNGMPGWQKALGKLGIGDGGGDSSGSGDAKGASGSAG